MHRSLLLKSFFFSFCRRTYTWIVFVFYYGLLLCLSLALKRIYTFRSSLSLLLLAQFFFWLWSFMQWWHNEKCREKDQKLLHNVCACICVSHAFLLSLFKRPWEPNQHQDNIPLTMMMTTDDNNDLWFTFQPMKIKIAYTQWTLLFSLFFCSILFYRTSPASLIAKKKRPAMPMKHFI